MNLKDTDRSLQARELKPFNGLVSVYQDDAYTLAYRVLGDPAAALEATQEAVIHAYRNLLTFRAASFQVRLLYSVAQTCQRRLRLDRRLAEGWLRGPINRIRSLAAHPPEQPEPNGDPIQDRLNQLLPAERLAVVLVDVLCLEYEQAARVLDEPTDHLQHHLTQARRKLACAA